MTKSALVKIRELNEQREKLMAGAKSEAIKKIDRVLKELKDLGFNYRLVAEGEPKSRSTKAGARRGKGRVKNARARYAASSRYHRTMPGRIAANPKRLHSPIKSSLSEDCAADRDHRINPYN